MHSYFQILDTASLQTSIKFHLILGYCKLIILIPDPKKYYWFVADNMIVQLRAAGDNLFSLLSRNCKNPLYTE